VLGPKPAARIALWGLAYKQDTHSLKNSAAIELLRAIEGTDCHAYDPVARIDPAAFPRVTVHARALDALTGADALVIMTPWRQFADIPPSSIRQRLSGDWVIDPYGVLDAGACRASGLRYARLGCA
jgi:UDPglucose 6-dehydrogenase